MGGIRKKVLLLFKQFQENARSESPRCVKLNYFSEMQNDALMHREG